MNILSKADFVLIDNATDKAKENMFVMSKTRLIKKFQTLQECNNKNFFTTNTKYVKESVIDLTSENLPEITQFKTYSIYFNNGIIRTKTRIQPKRIEAAQTLRKDVLRALKLHRSTKDNLTKQQRIALKEIREDNDIKIYPFDKGSGLVRIKSV